MRVLLIMDPGIPVPPPLYGGHERLVYMFAQEYTKLGHEVSLLAGPNSNITGKTYTFGLNIINRSKWQKFKELITAWKFLLTHKKDFDLVHNFGRLAYLLPILNFNTNKIMTYGRPIAKKGIKIINILPHKNLIFTACSNYCVATGNVAGNWKTVYNAINFNNYQLAESVLPNAPLMFLGRIDKIKGLHTAIKVALATKNTLWIGGNIPETADNYAYYQETIEPQFSNSQIVYLGALNDEQKNYYLSRSKALLFPIEWDEPFGMVMVEAMACGTPVIAFKRGAVPEVINENSTGFIVTNETEMINAVAKIANINRSNCRVMAQQEFDVSVIAKNYLNLFSND